MQFGNLDDALGFLLLAGWRYAQRGFTEAFNGLDITPASYGVLILVDKNPDCSVGDLGKAMGITPNNIARLVDRLCERELLVKSVDPHDARVRCLSISKQGRDFLSVLDERNAVLERDLYERLGRDRVDALLALLRPFTVRDNERR